MAASDWLYLRHGSLKVLRTFSYSGEGWGLTNSGNAIYMSDGSSQIRVWDAVTLRETSRITVKDGIRLVPELNELEYVRGEVFANVWHSEDRSNFT
jgi:glutaminyl-peptide cyclotransferase